MTRVVDRVEKAGFVRRESVPGDRRGVFVILTPEGEQAFLGAMDQHRSDIERFFGSRGTEHRPQWRAKSPLADHTLATFWTSPAPPPLLKRLATLAGALMRDIRRPRPSNDRPRNRICD